MDFLSEFEAAAEAPMAVSKTPFFASRSRSSSTTTREDDISDISMGASENRPGGTYGGSDDCEEDELCVQWQGSQVNAVLDSFLVNTPRKERMGESSNAPTLSTTTHATPSNRPPGPRARRFNALSSASSKARSKLSSASTLPTITTSNEENALPPVAALLQQLTKQSDENLASPSSSSSAFPTPSRGSGNSRQLGRPTSLGSDVFSTNRASAPRKALGRAVSGNAVIGRNSGSGIRDLKGKGKLRSDLWTVEEDEHHPAKRFKGDSAGNDTVHQPLKSGKGKEREGDMPPPALPPEAGGRWQSRMASSSSSLRVPNGNGDIAQARTLSQEMMPPPPLAFNPRTSKPTPSASTSISTHTSPPMLPPDISGVPLKTPRPYAGATTASSFSTAKKDVTPPVVTKPPTSASSSAYQPVVKYQNPHPNRQSSQTSRGSQHRLGGLSQNPVYPPASSQAPRASQPAQSKPPSQASSSQTPTTSHQPQPTTQGGPQVPTAALFSGPAPKVRPARLGMARSLTFNPPGTEPSYEVGTTVALSQPTSSSSSSSGSVSAANRSSCSYRSGYAGGGAGAHGVLSKAFRVPRSSAEVAKERVENLKVFLGEKVSNSDSATEAVSAPASLAAMGTGRGATVPKEQERATATGSTSQGVASTSAVQRGGVAAPRPGRFKPPTLAPAPAPAPAPISGPGSAPSPSGSHQSSGSTTCSSGSNSASSTPPTPEDAEAETAGPGDKGGGEGDVGGDVDKDPYLVEDDPNDSSFGEIDGFDDALLLDACMGY